MVPALTAEFLATFAAADEPGLAVGIYCDGELAASACAGCAVPEHGVPIIEHRAFGIASVSKHVTSACMLLLAGERDERRFVRVPPATEPARPPAPGLFRNEGLRVDAGIRASRCLPRR